MLAWPRIQSCGLVEELQTVAKAKTAEVTTAANQDQDKTSGITDIWAQNPVFHVVHQRTCCQLGYAA